MLHLILHVHYSCDESRGNYCERRHGSFCCKGSGSGNGRGSQDDSRLSGEVSLDIVGLYFRWRATHPYRRRQLLLLVGNLHSEIVELPEALTFEEVRLACRKKARLHNNYDARN